MFGPGRRAAQLEGSKAFAKRIMDDAGVPTGRAIRAGTLEEAITALDELGAPYVVKADGLAAGKGVLVTPDRTAAIEHATYYLGFGPVLIEEFLAGQEVSLFLLSDGHTVLPLSPAQDYKRIFDHDEGPNTGGMGAYSPLPWLPEGFVDEVIDTIALPTVRQLESERIPFIGLLYCGLIVTKRGIRVIEFNARFGDPETQVVLPRLITPLSGLLFAAATGQLAGLPRPEFSEEVAVAVVLASEGYPENPIVGRPITGLDAVSGVTIDHAATALVDGVFVATGGRVLSVVATGADFAAARERRTRPSTASTSRAASTGATSQSVFSDGPIAPSGPQHDRPGGHLPQSAAAMTASLDTSGWRHVYSGKVRDLYEHDELPGRLLVVASDRVSAFDHVLEPGIPGKGELLTRLSLWWFGQLDGIPNHLASADPNTPALPAEFAGRSMLVSKLDMAPDRVRRARVPRGQWMG